MAVGVLAVVLGGLWTLQGLDVVEGSVMSGVSLWAVIGPIVAAGRPDPDRPRRAPAQQRGRQRRPDQ